MTLHATRAALALLLAGAAFLPAFAHAQDAPPESRTRAWLALGIGAGFPTTGGDGITNMAQLVVRRQAQHLAFRGLLMHDIESPLDSLGKELGEVGALYGHSRRVLGRDAAFAAGLSVVGFEHCPRNHGSCVTLGLPLVFEGALTRRYVGIGGQWFANVNPKASYTGVQLVLQLGRH